MNSKELDYIIVGSGIAGVCFAETLLKNGKSIIVYDDSSQNSSRIAGGLYNPIILKRFSVVWKAKEQLDYLKLFYSGLEKKLKVKLDFELPVLRKLTSIEEQNNWFIESDNITKSSFLLASINKNTYDFIDSPFGFGQVLQSGYIDTKELIENFQNDLFAKGLLQRESFIYENIIFRNNCISYNNFNAKNIVFAEGFGLHLNPFFNYLPLDGTKGELLVIKAPNLKLDCIINSSIFILPLGNSLFKVGATYNWVDKTALTTQEGKDELTSKLKDLIRCDFEIVDHFAGVRPTVKDRRPLVGQHIEFKNCYILNGLGTRGVMLGPFLAKSLFENIEFGSVLDPEICIDRFH